MRVLILTNFQGNQLALANKMAGECEIAGIVFSRNVPRKRPLLSKKLRMLLNRAAGRTAGKEFVDVWFRMLAKYSDLYPEPPVENVVNVENVNDAETLNAIENLSP